MQRPRLTLTFWFGLGLILISAGFLLLDVVQRGGVIVGRSTPATALSEPGTALGHVARWFAVNFTALCWLGYLGVFDGLLERFRKPMDRGATSAGGDTQKTASGSPIRVRPNRFVVAWLTSIPVWCFFDTVNFYFMDAWRYHGLPEPFVARLAGYFIAFAAISPGMFVAAELYQRLGLRHLRCALNAPGMRRWNEWSAWGLTVGPPIAVGLIVPSLLIGRDDVLGDWLNVLGTAVLLLGPGLAAWYRNRTRTTTAFAFGVSFMLWTFLARDPLSNFTLWLGLIYLFDPINKVLGAPSLLRDWHEGRYGRTMALAAGGATCGLLWELWNYWAVAKWTYDLPFLGPLESVAYFEMPVLGFSGFLPFAAECWVVLNTILWVLWRLRLRVAEPLPDVDTVI
jgi:hypothetical protein